MAAIVLDLAHAYGPNPQRDEDYALLPLKMRFEDGGAYALLGPSGCGKTTLLNLVSGLVIPSQGTVNFDGRDVTRLSPQQRNIAQVFQFPVIYDTMTVAENLAFPLRNRGVPAAKAKQRVGQIAEMLDLSAQLDLRAAGLAADAKQKISLGRGLVREDVSAGGSRNRIFFEHRAQELVGFLFDSEVFLELFLEYSQHFVGDLRGGAFFNVGKATGMQGLDDTVQSDVEILRYLDKF